MIPRIAQRETENIEQNAFESSANDNRPVMTKIELSRGTCLKLRSEERLDNVRGEWHAGLNIVAVGARVAILDDGPTTVNKPIGDNDNEAVISWPLGKALKTDEQRRLLKAAAAYRRLYECSNATGVLQGSDMGDGIYRLDQRTWVRPDGEIVYKGARMITSGDPDPLSPTGSSGGEKKPVAKKWNGDVALISKMDARPLLAEIERRVGPLLQPVEQAVLGGWTLEAIGRHEAGYSDKQRASAVGKALVYRALAVIASYIEEPALQPALRELGMVGLN
jgi:hypothetical protein